MFDRLEAIFEIAVGMKLKKLWLMEYLLASFQYEFAFQNC